MAGTKDYFFKPNTLLRLLCHYTDGEVPMNAEATDFLVNQNLGRIIGIVATSHEWSTSEPLHVRYDGKRIASWAKNEGTDEMVWEERNDAPKRQ